MGAGPFGRTGKPSSFPGIAVAEPGNHPATTYLKLATAFRRSEREPMLKEWSRSPAAGRTGVARVGLPGAALSGIDFGAPAAERDIERGLAEYFVESAVYNRVRVGSKRIVIGARGIGKSAIFQVLARRERDAGSYVIELSPEDYSYELLSQTMASEDHGSWAKLGAYAVAWKYLIYVLIMKEISKKRTHYFKKGVANEIYKYVRDNHSNQQASALSSLVSYLKRLEGVKIGKYEATVKARELEKLYKLEEIHHLLPALKEIVSHKRVIVLVDELDRGWDSSEDARAFVAGLFQACISVNSIHDNLRVYMSLRQELYDDVPALYDDAQKYRDLIETIGWNDSSLLNLMAKRIRHSMPALAAADDQTCWNSLFSTIPGNSNGSFGYMIDRTLYRPREIIQFCTQAIECCRDSQAGIPLRSATIREAERIYSAERTKDIAAEHRFQHPGLMSVMEAFRGRTSTLGRADLEFICLELITGEIPAAGTGSWLDNCTPDDLIEILWNVGFLRAEAGGDVSSRKAAGHAFLGNHQARHLNMAAAQRFQVHPMFHAYLGITQAGPVDKSR
jgi:hypothetical protein